MHPRPLGFLRQGAPVRRSVRGSRRHGFAFLFSFIPCLMMAGWQPAETAPETGLSQEAIVNGVIGSVGWPCTDNTSDSRERPAQGTVQGGRIDKAAQSAVRIRPVPKGRLPVGPWQTVGQEKDRVSTCPSLLRTYSLFTVHYSLFNARRERIPAHQPKLRAVRSSPGNRCRSGQTPLTYHFRKFPSKWHPGKTGPWLAETSCQPQGVTFEPRCKKQRRWAREFLTV